MHRIYVTDRLLRGQKIALTIKVQLPSDMMGLTELRLSFQFEKDTLVDKIRTVSQSFGHEL
jgi:hypothetical protein